MFEAAVAALAQGGKIIIIGMIGGGAYTKGKFCNRSFRGDLGD